MDKQTNHRLNNTSLILTCCLITVIFAYGLTTEAAEKNNMPTEQPVVLSNDGRQLSPFAAEGKQVYALCHACHNPENNPPLAPPMFGVQKHYKRANLDKRSFINNIVDFVKNPSMERVRMRRPAMELGLMPAQDLPEVQLAKAAAYIFEESFPLPCAHWEIVVKIAEEKGEVDNHIQRDKMKLERFCSQ